MGASRQPRPARARDGSRRPRPPSRAAAAILGSLPVPAPQPSAAPPLFRGAVHSFPSPETGRQGRGGNLERRHRLPSRQVGSPEAGRAETRLPPAPPPPQPPFPTVVRAPGPGAGRAPRAGPGPRVGRRFVLREGGSPGFDGPRAAGSRLALLP